MYLQKSVAAPFLVHYFPDCVGMSAYSSTEHKPVQYMNGNSKTKKDDQHSGTGYVYPTIFSLFTVSSCLYVQSVSSEIRMKVSGERSMFYIE